MNFLDNRIFFKTLKCKLCLDTFRTRRWNNVSSPQIPQEIPEFLLLKSSYKLTKHRIEVSIRARSGGGRGRDSSSHRRSILTDVAFIHGGVVAMLQQLAALPGDVLIGVRCCYGAVVSSLRIPLLVVAVVVSTAVRAVATAEPDNDDEQDEKDDADAGGDAHQNLRGQEVRCGLGFVTKWF
jgi:hypothetical protein